MASVFVWPIFFFSLFLSSAAVGLMLNTRNVDTTSGYQSEVSRGMNCLFGPSVLSLQGFVDVNTVMEFKPRVTNQIEAAKPCVTSKAEQLLPLAS